MVFSTVGLRFWAMLISAPAPRDVALPQELTIVSWRRALASNVLMRHVRTVQQVYKGQRPEVLPNLPIFSSHKDGNYKILLGTLSSRTDHFPHLRRVRGRRAEGREGGFERVAVG